MEVESNPVFRCIEGKSEGVFSMHPAEVGLAGAAFMLGLRLHPVLGMILAGLALLGLRMLKKKDHDRSDYLLAWGRLRFAPSRRYRPADSDGGYVPLGWE